MRSSRSGQFAVLQRARSQSLWVTALVLFLTLGGSAVSLRAQVLYGSLVGNVTDESGAAVPGATVTVTHKETGASRETVAYTTGAYRFANLQSGNSYGIRLKEQHCKFPQPELGPWVENSRTVGADWKPSVLEGWEPPLH